MNIFGFYLIVALVGIGSGLVSYAMIKNQIETVNNGGDKNNVVIIVSLVLAGICLACCIQCFQAVIELFTNNSIIEIMLQI